MKLQSMNCPNCNGQLKKEGENFICSSCGSAFTIDYDEADVKYTELVTQADRTKMLLQSDLEVMQTDFQLSESMADREQQRKLQKELKDSLKTATKAATTYLVVMGIGFAAVIAMVIWSSKNWKSHKEQQAAKDKESAQQLVELVTSDLHFLENEVARGQNYEYKIRIGSPVTDTRFLQERTAHLAGDPEMTDLYLMAEKTSHAPELWIVYQIPYVYDDTYEQIYIYDVVSFNEIAKDKYGDPTANEHAFSRSSNTGWRGFFEKDQLYRELLLGYDDYEIMPIDTLKGGADK